MDRQEYCRYCTLFWPKYWAAEGRGARPRAHSASARPANARVRRMKRVSRVPVPPVRRRIDRVYTLSDAKGPGRLRTVIGMRAQYSQRAFRFTLKSGVPTRVLVLPPVRILRCRSSVVTKKKRLR